MTNKPVQAGSADVSVVVRAFDITTGAAKTDITNATSGLEIRYWRGAAGAVTTVAPASQTSTGAHTDGGIVHKHGGAYRVDLPDAAVAAPAGDTVSVTLAGVADTVFTVAELLLTTDDVTAAGLTAAELQDDAITMLQSFERTNSAVTLNDSTGTPVVMPVTPNADLLPIAAITAPE